MKNRGTTHRLIVLFIIILLSLSVLQYLWALPEGENVEAGNASFDRPDAATLRVTADDKTVINFNSFNIASNEAVYFIQPSSSASLLSRVTGPEASRIAGLLAANGTLFLVNPQGIYFEPTANVQANNLVASTLEISTQNFLNDRYIFEHLPDKLYTQLLNEGRIEGQNIAFLGSAVKNAGIILARAGTVHLASGDKTTLSLDAKGIMQVEINEKTSGKVVDINGVSVKEAVANSGTIEGASVFMSAKTADGIFSQAINQSGIIKSICLAGENGIIRISSDQNIRISGAIGFEGAYAKGRIEITADGPIEIGLTKFSNAYATSYLEAASGDSINVNSPVHTSGAVVLRANKDIKIAADFTNAGGDLKFIADADLDGIGAFNQAKATFICTLDAGDVTLQSSGEESTLANITSSGNLILKAGGRPAVYTQQPDSEIKLASSLIIAKGVTLKAANTIYEIGKDWIPEGVFIPETSHVRLVSEQEARIAGANTFYDLTIAVPGKIVRFDPGTTQAIVNNLTLRGEYGKLLVLGSIEPPEQWKILPQGTTDIAYVILGDSINIRGPPLKAIHSSSAGNLTNWDLDPYWTGQGLDNNWSTPDNWDTGTVPTAFDIVTFDGTNHAISNADPNKDSVVDTAFQGTIASFTIDGYTGTLTLGRNLIVTGDITINSGTIIAETSGTLTIEAQNGSIYIGENVLISAENLALIAEQNIDISGTFKGNSVSLRSINGNTLLKTGSLIDVSTNEAGAIGGRVEILGRQVLLFGVQINASGFSGGGTVLIGGDFQGNGTAVNSTNIYVSRDAYIYADAVDQGDGGKVIVWSNNSTQYYGYISACGGAQGGNGGFVQVSGAEYLEFNGFVDALAPNGARGTFILDPTATSGYAATVATDALDYKPGETVTIMGIGWQAGEAVSLVLHPQKDTLSDMMLTIVADANGNFSDSSFTPQEQDRGVAFAVTAAGQSSGLAAETRFTDAAVTTAATGNWSGATTSAWPNTTRTGTITSSTSSTTVTGSSTSFTTQLSVGNTIWRSTGVLVGTIASIQSNTSLTLTANASSTQTNRAFYSNGVGSGDTVSISSNYTVTVDGNYSITSVTFTSSGATLSVSSPYTLTVNGAVTLNNAAAANVTATITGAGSLSCTSVAIGNGTAATGDTTTYTHALTSTIIQLTDSGNLTINSYFVATNRIRNGVFYIGSGTVTVNGSVTTVNANAANTSLFSMATGAQTGTLALGGATPFTISGTGTSTLTLNGTSATVTYNYAGAQTVRGVTYTNLTLSGSGAKTTTNATVNGILSMEGTATTTGTVATYGAAATLQYKGSAAQTTGTEFATFGGSGGVIINNASGVNLGGSVTITYGLTLTSGTFAVGANTLTLNGATIAGTPTNLSTTSSSSLVFGGSSSSVNIPSSVTALSNLTINNANGVTSNSSLTISGTLTVTSGTLDLSGGAYNLNMSGGTLNNSGTIKIANGTITDASSITSRGSWNFTAAKDLPAWTNYSTLTLSGAVAYTTAGSITCANLTVSSASGTFAFDASENLTVSSAINNSGTITFNNGSLSLNTITNMGSWTFQTARDIPASTTYGTLTLSGAVAYTTAGSITCANLTVSSASGTFAFDASENLTVSSAINNSGTITFNNGSLSLNTITNMGSWTFQTARDIPASTTYGTLTLSGAVAYTTAGSITCANLTVSSASGTFAFDASENLTVSSAINNAGTITMGSGTIDFGSSTSNTGTIVIVDGTVTDLPSTIGGTLNFQSDTDRILPNNQTYNNLRLGRSAGSGTTHYTMGSNTTISDTWNIDVDAQVMATVTGTFTANNKVYDGDATATILVNSLSLSGIVNGQTVTLTKVLVFSDKNVDNGKTVSLTGSSLGGADAGYYTLSLVGAPTTTANITAKALTVTATGPAKTYGTALTAGTSEANFTHSGEISGESVSSVTLTPNAAGLSATTAAGAAYLVTPSLATGTGGFLESNYSVTYNNYNGSVAQKAMTVTATGPAKTYGTALTAGTSEANFTHSGEISGESVSSVTLTPNAAGLSATTAAGAAYLVTPSLATGTGGFLESNYSVTYNNYNGSVAQKAMTVTGSFTANNKVYNGDATTTILVNNLILIGIVGTEDVTLTPVVAFSNKNVASAKTVSLTGSSLDGADKNNYNLSLVGAPTTTADITAKELSVSGVTASNKAYDGTTTAALNANNAALADMIAGDIVTLNKANATGVFSDKNVGTGKTVSVSGLSISGSDCGNYFLTQPTTTANITSSDGSISTPVTVVNQAKGIVHGESILYRNQITQGGMNMGAVPILVAAPLMLVGPGAIPVVVPIGLPVPMFVPTGSILSGGVGSARIPVMPAEFQGVTVTVVLPAPVAPTFFNEALPTAAFPSALFGGVSSAVSLPSPVPPAAIKGTISAVSLSNAASSKDFVGIEASANFSTKQSLFTKATTDMEFKELAKSTDFNGAVSVTSARETLSTEAFHDTKSSSSFAAAKTRDKFNGVTAVATISTETASFKRANVDQGRTDKKDDSKS